MEASRGSNIPGLTKTVKIDNAEFAELRAAYIEEFGSDEKFREWLKGKFIKLSYGRPSIYQPLDFARRPK